MPAHRFSSVVLVDPRGRLLLQERDEHPVIDPDKWGFVGGGVEPGEDYRAAAYRELAEETGIRLDAGLELFGVYDVFHAHDGSDDEFSLWLMPTDLTDGDIVVGEGRRICFVPPERARALDLTAAARIALPLLLDSARYQEMTTEMTR